MTVTVSAKLLKCHSETQRRAPVCSRARHRVQTSFLARWDSIKVYMYSATHSPRPIIITFADGKEDCNRREEQNSLMQTEEEGMGGRVKAGRQPEIFFQGCLDLRRVSIDSQWRVLCISVLLLQPVYRNGIISGRFEPRKPSPKYAQAGRESLQMSPWTTPYNMQLKITTSRQRHAN